MKNKLFGRTFLFAPLFFAGVAGLLAGAEPELYYHYRSAKQALEIDATTVAVNLNRSQEAPADVARSLATRAAGLGFKSRRGQGNVAHGWIDLDASEVVGNVGGNSQKAKQRQVISLLENLPEVAFVAPVFKDKLGQPLTFGPRLLIGFHDNVNEAQQNATLQRIPRITSMRRTAKSHHWVLETNFRHGLDLLDVANELGAMSIVRYAEPDFRMTPVLTNSSTVRPAAPAAAAQR